ncbi:MAG: hypothetical protein GIKADHBN_01251 [Phycisphaerales bacterium]|nr:hypothetical protein [Phycisphaerales bacterium]
MLITGLGEAQQRRLLASTALIVGCGALGCTAADLLARAGVGAIILIDRDVVELTNLQRQTLFDEDDARQQAPKAIAAARRLTLINSSIRPVAEVTDFTHRNAIELLERHRPDVLLDCSDNFQTRFLMNDVAVSRGVPLAYAGVIATGGMQYTILPGVTPCLRCIFDAPPAEVGPTCDTAGVLGPAVTIAASYQAMESLKLLASVRDRLRHTLVQFDLWKNKHREVSAGPGPRPDCPCCGRRTFEFLDGSRADTAAVLCGRHTVQIWPANGQRTPLHELHARLAAHGDFVLSPVLVRGTLAGVSGETGTPIELTVFSDGRTLVRGTSSIERARALHARYVGT